MGSIELDEMSLDDLKKLRKDVTKAIDGFEDRQKQTARLELEARAREMGFSLSDLVEPGRKGAKKVNPPKYRHPENPELTWSGRGRRPQWVTEIIDKGGNMDDFLI